MNLANLLSSLVVFFGLAAFGAIVFTLAHFASRGTFSPTVLDDATREENGSDDATDEGTAPAGHPTRGRDAPSPFDS